MNTDILFIIIDDAQKQNKAVELYINFIHERITIEPEEEIDLVDNGILKIGENTYISIDYVSMARIIKNEKERMEELKELIEEVKGGNNVQIRTNW